MKKLFLIFLFLLIACPAWGATYTVCASGCDKTTVQSALDSYTSSGDIIELRASTIGGTVTFNETLSAKANNITLQCRNYSSIMLHDTCIVNGSGISANVIMEKQKSLNRCEPLKCSNPKRPHAS